jgi:hypothetical protein
VDRNEVPVRLGWLNKFCSGGLGDGPLLVLGAYGSRIMVEMSSSAASACRLGYLLEELDQTTFNDGRFVSGLAMSTALTLDRGG